MKKKTKILIIEDDRDMTEALKITLESYSYRVILAFDGVQGLQMVRKENPDLIILDLLLPREDGVTLCCQLKQREEYAHIPILVLTAMVRKIEETIFSTSPCSSLPADDYVTKPIQPEELLERVKRLLDKTL